MKHSGRKYIEITPGDNIKRLVISSSVLPHATKEITKTMKRNIEK